MSKVTLRKNTMTNQDNVIDIRDAIERFEELESAKQVLLDAYQAQFSDPTAQIIPATTLAEWDDSEDGKEFLELAEFLSECEGNGGDAQWRGDWYPLTAISDSYFNDYMDEMLVDIGALPKDLPSYLSVTVDYDALQQDYTAVDFSGQCYWVR